MAASSFPSTSCKIMGKATKFVHEPSSHLVCPLCGGIFRDPVISKMCGHSFCRVCVFQRLESSGTVECPQDGSLTTSDQDLFPNKSLESQVGDLHIYCCHSLTWSDATHEYILDPNSCHENIILARRDEHEEECEYAFMSCPNNPDVCGRFRRRAEQSHYDTKCAFLPCSHRDKGCEFRGNKQSATDHEATCGYRSLAGSVGHQEYSLHVGELQTENKELRSTVDTLTGRVSRLEQTNQRLEEDLLDMRSMMNKLREEQEKLQSTVERLAVRRQRTGSTSSRSRPASVASLTHSGSPVEHWTMPFQFKCIGTLRGHGSSVFAMARSGSTLYSSGGDKVIKKWDLNALVNGCLASMKGHTDVVHSLTVNGAVMYSASADGSLKAWSSDTCSLLNSVPHGHEWQVCAMITTDDHLFTSSQSCIKVWELPTLALVKTISGLHHWVRALVLSQSRDVLYSGSHNTVQLWEARGNFSSRGEILHDFGSVYSLAVTSQYLIIGTYNRNVQVYDINTRQHAKKLAGHIGAITCLKVSPSGRFLFSASHDCTVQLWSLETFLPIQTLKRHEGNVNTLVLYRDLLLSGSDDTEMKVFKHFQMST